MIHMEIVRHRVAVAGWVTDAQTAKPIQGGEVTIGGMPPAFSRKLQYAPKTQRPDQAYTREDGLFYFLDLPNGDYIFKISAPNSGKRYASAEAKATVARDGQGNLKMVTVKAALHPTTVKGKVTGPNHTTGVVLAEVRIKGSGEQTYSDARGEFVLSAIEPGTRTIQVFAQGYRPASHVVKLAQPGALETVNVPLIREGG